MSKISEMRKAVREAGFFSDRAVRLCAYLTRPAACVDEDEPVTLDAVPENHEGRQ